MADPAIPAQVLQNPNHDPGPRQQSRRDRHRTPGLGRADLAGPLRGRERSVRGLGPMVLLVCGKVELAADAAQV